jgi:hypothetical protein
MAATFCELIIKGDDSLLLAYMHGFLTGKKIKRGVVFSNECPLEIHQLREMIEYHGEVLHLICRTGLKATLVSAIKNAPEQYSFEIKKEQRISAASFAFEFATFSKNVASILKKTFSRIPAGLKFVKYEPQEKIDPEAAGPEGYAPLHDYKFFGEGEVLGDIETILRFHRKLSRNDFIEIENIHLIY